MHLPSEKNARLFSLKAIRNIFLLLVLLPSFLLLDVRSALASILFVFHGGSCYSILGWLCILRRRGILLA